MSTAIDDFAEQKFCGTCEDQMAKLGQPPNKLVLLPEKTAKKRLVVKICPYCDPHLVGEDL